MWVKMSRLTGAVRMTHFRHELQSRSPGLIWMRFPYNFRHVLANFLHCFLCEFNVCSPFYWFINILFSIWNKIWLNTFISDITITKRKAIPEWLWSNQRRICITTFNYIIHNVVYVEYFVYTVILNYLLFIIIVAIKVVKTQLLHYYNPPNLVVGKKLHYPLQYITIWSN